MTGELLWVTLLVIGRFAVRVRASAPVFPGVVAICMIN
jgi:hypothetical protein